MKRVLFTAFVLVTSIQSLMAQETCGRADPTYIRTANETGGIPMFLQRTEVDKSFQLIRESTRNNVSTVFWGTASIERRPETIDIPVDSTTKRVTFTSSFARQGSTLTITTPSGGPLPRDAEITELHCGRIVTVVGPETGIWKAAVAGQGTYWLEVQAQSDLHLLDVQFVREGGRPGHEGYFRIEGQPVVDKPAVLRVSLSPAGARTAEFFLASQSGSLLEKIPMQRTTSSGDIDEYLGNVRLPSLPFRIAVRGVDANNTTYQRYFGSLFHAETVELSLNRTFDEIAAGTSKILEFTIRNPGAARTFQVTITDAHRFVKTETREATLAAGQSGTIRVEVTVPPGTAEGTNDDVIVVATSTMAPATTNSSIGHLSVTK